MILVDTSIWIDHFRKPNKHLQQLLLNEEVNIHEFIIGELYCGNFSNRSEILSLLKALPKVKTNTNTEIFNFIEHNKLYGLGIGFIDVHLLAASLINDVMLWTKNKRLDIVAAKFHCAYNP